MARFKYTGERLTQLRKESKKTARRVAIEAAEHDLGRSLTAEEMREVVTEVDRVINNSPVYGGDA